MQTLSKIKIGPFLVISSVLVAWTLLIAQHVQAHKPDSPTCSGLPTATDFFDANTAAIIPGTLTPALTTRQGTGSAMKGGDTRFRYAKITVPQLAAGELRVFDTRTDAASDAVLCHGSSTRASHRTTHPSSHTSAENARTSALTAQTTAEAAGSTETSNTITESGARTALRNAATALRSAANALRSAVTAIQRAELTPPGDSITIADAAHTPASGGNPASGHAADADADAADGTKSLADLKTDLGTAAGHLGTLATALRAAANVLHNADAAFTVFQLRAEVRPGDLEYILVTTDDAPTLAVQFNGAIAATTVQRDRTLSAGQQHIFPITVTAPGLLTVETTGSTDTIGMLDSTDNLTEYAHAESGGSGGNFKFVVPVAAAEYEVVVEGQTTRTTGAYTVGMDFKVAMTTSATATGIDVAGAPTWASTGIPGDDTTLQIDGSADADYFLFTIDTDSGFLTVNANNDSDGSTKDANTSATLYGAMGEGPMGEMRTGQIATDADSGPSGHFKFAVPVEAGGVYLVEVRGTDGVYELAFDFDAVTDAMEKITPPTSPLSGGLEAAASGADLDKDLYLFNIEESGTLYIHSTPPSTGTTDVYGTLYGPDGTLIAEDDDSGEGVNFRIAARVAPGLHLLEVTGQNRQTAGSYGLVVNFVSGPGPEPPTDPTPPTDPPPTTDANGILGNPPPDSTRSGIGIISGWVCQASNVTITIRPVGEGGTNLPSFTAGYGADRPDTVGECDHNSPNTGFGMAFNFNRLAEGEYEIEARADGQLINTTARRFTVVYLVPGDEFLEDLEREVEVSDFPTTGQTTTLEWQESLQNFIITDVQ